MAVVHEDNGAGSTEGYRYAATPIDAFEVTVTAPDGATVAFFSTENSLNGAFSEAENKAFEHYMRQPEEEAN